MIPRYSTENVAGNVITALLECDYDKDKLEIIPINEGLNDGIAEILRDYHDKYPFIKPIQRLSEDGKTVDLNDALEKATGEIIIVFEEKYRPSKNLLKKLASAFKNPKVGAVTSRVIPFNKDKNLLTVLHKLEKSGGYQVERQARYNMKLLPQYDGGVIGFRKSIVLSIGGFDTKVLSQDKELAYRMYCEGWDVVYDNSAACYEEAPKLWKIRGEQIRRWSREHNEIAFKYFFKFLFSSNISIKGKFDGVLLLNTSAMSFILFIAHMVCMLLFFLGEVSVFGGWIAIILLGMCNVQGNFAPFFEIGTSTFIDGTEGDVLALPYICISFYFYMWYISLGYIDAVIDKVTNRNVRVDRVRNFNEDNLIDTNDFEYIVNNEEGIGKDINDDELFLEEIDIE